jgi:hypothetical protein
VGSVRSDPSTTLERVAFTVPEFCFRNHISRQKYNEMKSNGRGPAEMRVGINTVRITAESERNWQQLMQEPQPDVEAKAVERAVKAGAAAAKSPKHISKRGRKSATERQKASQQQTNSQLTTKTVADRQRVIRELSAQLRKARKLSKQPPKRRACSEQPRPDNVGADESTF